MTLHERLHALPPSLANRRRGNGFPLFHGLDLCVSKKGSLVGMQENTVLVNAVIFQDLLQLGPYGIVALLIECRLPRVQGHDKRFSNHEAEESKSTRSTEWSCVSKITIEERPVSFP